MVRFSRATPGRRCSGAGVSLILLLASGCAIQPNDNTLPGQVAVGDDGYGVSVVFDKVENLVPNSQVLKDNVVIGTVASIDVVDWQARVQLRLLDSVDLPTTSVFSIGQKTLLGAQYVEVEVPEASAGSQTAATSMVASSGLAGQPSLPPPTSGLLGDGDVVPVTQTGTYPATEQVLGAVALLLNNGGLSQISTITGELSTALRGRTPDARDLIRQSNALLAVLDENKGQIVRALESLNRLSANLASDRSRIAQAIDRITPGLKSLEQERERLVSAVTATGRAGTRAVGVIQTSERALLANLDSLEPILSNLGKVSSQLPEALKLAVTIPFPAMTTENALRGDYANLFATLDLRGSSLASAFVGLDPPALQASDPVLGPLTLPLPDVVDEAAGAAATALDPGPRPGPQDSDGDGAGQGQPRDDEPCLIPTLGLCR